MRKLSTVGAGAGDCFLLFDGYLKKPYRYDPRLAAFCRKVGSPLPGDATIAIRLAPLAGDAIGDALQPASPSSKGS